MIYIELPNACSKLFQVEQEGVILNAECDLNHRMRVRIKNLAGEIKVSFLLPRAALVLTTLGLMGMLLLCFSGTFILQLKKIAHGKRYFPQLNKA